MSAGVLAMGHQLEMVTLSFMNAEDCTVCYRKDSADYCRAFLSVAQGTYSTGNDYSPQTDAIMIPLPGRYSAGICTLSEL